MPQPSTSATPHLPSYRRITTSSKLRENRPQSGIIGPPVRRRRSRSPEVHTTEEFGLPNTRTDLKKRKPASLIANHNHSTILARTQQSLPTPEEQVGDRGRKGKSRYRPSSQVSEEVDTYGLEDAQNRHNLRLKKAESSPSPFAHYKPSTPEISDAEDGRSSSGRHAVSDYARMSRELEALRKVGVDSCWVLGWVLCLLLELL